MKVSDYKAGIKAKKDAARATAMTRKLKSRFKQIVTDTQITKVIKAQVLSKQTKS